MKRTSVIIFSVIFLLSLLMFGIHDINAGQKLKVGIITILVNDGYSLIFLSHYRSLS